MDTGRVLFCIGFTSFEVFKNYSPKAKWLSLNNYSTIFTKPKVRCFFFCIIAKGLSNSVINSFANWKFCYNCLDYLYWDSSKFLVEFNPLTPRSNLYFSLLTYLTYNFYYVSSENFVSNQLTIPKLIFSLFSSLIWLILYWYCKEKFCLGHSWELKG